jgi:uncharacterized protein (TIGR02172 family)
LTDRERLGQGYTADIYPWGENRVIKLFQKGISESSINREFSVSKLVETLGLNVPKVFERRQYQGREGILYERIDGPTMTQAISQEPGNIKKFACKLAALHDVIHRKKGMGLPEQKDVLSRRIYQTDLLSVNTKKKILHHLELLPEGSQVCHGDFHTNNIIISSHGAVIIDWMDGTCGHPLADVARTVLIYRLASISDRVVKSQRDSIIQEYLNAYIQLSNCSLQQINTWELPVAAARLTENIPTEEKERLLFRIEQLIREDR